MPVPHPKVHCPCESGRTAEECCAPPEYPVSDAQMPWRDLNIRMLGVGLFGQQVPVPADLTTIITVNQPHHVDDSIVEALEPWHEALLDQVRGLRPEAAIAKLNTVGMLEQNVGDSLHAARYHQRQFLCRFRAVDQRNAVARASGSQQLQVVFNDLPLRCEMEAFLVRTSASLDTLTQLLGRVLTGKQRKYGEFLKALDQNRQIDATLRSALKSILQAHDGWIQEAKNYRHSIVHESEFSSFRGPLLGAHGISSAALAQEDAADFVVRIWSSLRRLMRDVAGVMHQHGSRWRLPDS